MDNLSQVFCMAAGDAPSSYAANSSYQGYAIATAKPVVQQSVEELCCNMLPGQKLVVADLGCSYGPNVFAVISEVIEAIDESCCKLRCSLPSEIQFFLNDLPANDFNSIFRSLASYKKKVKEEKGEEIAGRFYVAGVPGTFHGRLFPCRSVNLFHSSSSVHWLSQVPEGLKDGNNNELNKGNIHVGKTSPPCVHKSYLQQFHKDFSAFLGCRSEEIQDGGFMVLMLAVRRSSDPHSGGSFFLFENIKEVLMSMAEEGIIKEADIDSFNMPFYDPSIEELHAIVTDQGAFKIAGETEMDLRGDGYADCDEQGNLLSNQMRGQISARNMRAVLEALLACHFREANIVDDMFTRLASIFTREFEKGKQFIFPYYILTLKKLNSL